VSPMDSEEMKMIHVATVKPSASPHVVPVLALCCDGKVYFAADRGSVKVRNILNNNNVAAITADGYRAVITEGKARILSEEEVTDRITDLFREKHPWRPRFERGSTQVLVEITPNKIMKK
jgi:nitroimidazol reductase NimA-like FMN-containing flavoprotein (pyridoxamine 5'-phosphate oxidase superfamily)